MFRIAALSIELRVGALPQHPRGKLGYALNWSPEGVINEYINDCEVIRNGHPQMVPALEGLEMILVNGLMLESFTTSGGRGRCVKPTWKSAGIELQNHALSGPLRVDAFPAQRTLSSQ